MSSRGFSMLETVLSTAIFSMIFGTAVLVSGSSMSTTADAVRDSGEQTKQSHIMDALGERLLRAAISTMEAVPEGGKAPEPLQEDQVYDHLLFRSVTGFSKDQPIYVPGMESPPYGLVLSTRPLDGDLMAYQNPPTADLMFFDGKQSVVICSGVTQLSFVKNGPALTVAIDRAVKSEKGLVTTEFKRTFLLRIP